MAKGKIVKISNARLKRLQNAPGNSIVVDTESHGTDDAELYQQSGVYSRPQDGIEGVQVDVNGNNIVIATHSYKLKESIEKGETLIYSYDSDGILQGKLKVDIDGKFIFNDGVDFAVRFNQLKIAFDALVTSFNNHMTAYTAHVHPDPVSGNTGPPPVAGVPTTANMDNSKIDEIKVPEYTP